MTTTISPDTVPALDEDVARVPVGDELLLHREDDGTLLLLDPIGALMLTLVDGRRPVRGIVDELVAVFDDAERAVVERDVLASLERLRDEGLLALRRHAGADELSPSPVGDREDPGPWRRRVDVLSRRVEDKWVLLAADGEDALVLDGIGALVWDLLTTPCTLAELVTLLSDATDTDAARVRDDVVPFLLDLEGQRLVERT